MRPEREGREEHRDELAEVTVPPTNEVEAAVVRRISVAGRLFERRSRPARGSDERLDSIPVTRNRQRRPSHVGRRIGSTDLTDRTDPSDSGRGAGTAPRAMLSPRSGERAGSPSGSGLLDQETHAGELRQSLF